MTLDSYSPWSITSLTIKSPLILMPDFSIAPNLRYRLRFRLVQFDGFRSIPSGYELLMFKQTLNHRYSFSNILVIVEKGEKSDIPNIDKKSADNSVRMFDRCNLTSGPVHIFAGHSEVVLYVQWSPDRSSVFGSLAEDGILNVWDHKLV